MACNYRYKNDGKIDADLLVFKCSVSPHMMNARRVDSDDSLSSYDDADLSDQEEIKHARNDNVVNLINQNQPVPAVMEIDHEFMTYLFNLFSPLMCFSYTDSVDDLHYIASKKKTTGKLKPAQKKNEQRRESNSGKNKSKVSAPRREVKEKPDESAGQMKSEKRKSVENIDVAVQRSIKEDPVTARKAALQLYSREAYQKGMLYFGYQRDPKHPMNWELQKNASEVKVYTCQFEPQDLQFVVKSHYSVGFALDVVLQSLIDENFLMDLDTSLDSFEILDSYDPNMLCRRYAYKSYWPISPRDFVVVTCWHKLDDGCTMLTTVSVPNEWCPPTGTHVRAYITFSGSLMKRLDDKTTEITMMSHSNLETSIPVSIINSTAVGIPISFVTHFRKFLKIKENSIKARIQHKE